MRLAMTLGAILLLAACGGGEGQAEADASPATESTMAMADNTLSDAEVAEGWTLLFNGENTEGWRGYNMDAFPAEGWAVGDGHLIVHASDGSEEGLGGDIVTVEEYTNFELLFDFKVSPVGNSGIFYLVAEDEAKTMWQMAPEFQVLDDAAYIEMGGMDMNTHLTGDNYDLQSSLVTASNPIGEWNQARILVNNNHVEHWLNGQMTVEYEIRSPEWETLVAKSKFAEHEGYGRATTGRIGIQDHGHEIRYRNLKIRSLDD